MDQQRFEAMARALAAPRSRRRVLTLLAATTGAGLLGTGPRRAASAPTHNPATSPILRDPAPAVMLGAVVLRADLDGAAAGDPDGAGRATAVLLPGRGLTTRVLRKG